MLIIVRQMLSSCLETWRQVDFRKVEVALLLVYMLGEALPVSELLDTFTSSSNRDVKSLIFRSLKTCYLTQAMQVSNYYF